MNNTTSFYRIELKPLEKFFFGGYRSDFKEEYFLRSNLFPQQTGALGLLRYEVLKRKKLLDRTNKGMQINDFPKAEKYIGNQSFDGISFDFGVIKRISPILLSCDESKNIFYQSSFAQDKNYKSLSAKVYYGNNDIKYQKVYFFDNEDYDTKKYESDVFKSLNCYGNINMTCDKFNNELDNGVFAKELQVGITKNYKGISKDKAFYKMEFLRMNPNFSYCFFAEIDNQDNLFPQIIDNLDVSKVFFGKERSFFKLSIRKVDTFFKDTQAINTGKIILLSDAYVDNDIYKECKLVVSNTINFRNLKTKTKADENHSKEPVSSHTYGNKTLLKRGSLLICDKTKVVENELRKNEAFNKIGYNYYITR